jgi:hypothetical protein
MRTTMLMATLPLLAVGCTAMSLERRTVNQALSVTDLRYREVMQNLAAIADDPSRLPAFAVIDSGITQVTDTAGVDSKTAFDRAISGFAKQASSVAGKRSPDQNWTVEPVASQPQLEAIRCACLVVLNDPAACSPACVDLLRRAAPLESPGYHFDVADQLQALPCGWLHRGGRADVPKNACHVAHHHDTYVWVTPDGLQGLADFTLIVLDIATVSLPSLLLAPPTAAVSTEVDVNGVKRTIKQTVRARQQPVNLNGIIVWPVVYDNPLYDNALPQTIGQERVQPVSVPPVIQARPAR